MTDALHEAIYDMRQIAGRGTVLATHDTGQAQTVDVQCYDGVIRTGIEVHQAFGHASRAPLDGAVVLLLGIEADPGHLVAIPSANFSFRFGNLADGESVIYGADGSRVAIRQGGTIQVLAATLVAIAAPNVTITATGGGTVQIAQHATIAGNLMVGGDITVTGTLSAAAAHFSGDVTIGGTLNGHAP